jgi:hypothetical protein
VVGAEAALAGRKAVADPGAGQLEPGDRLEVAGHEREPERLRPLRQRVEQLDDPGREPRREVLRAEVGVGLDGARGDLAGARVDLRGLDPRGEQQRARDRQVRPAGRLDGMAVQLGDAVDVLRRLDDRPRVLGRGALEQRAVDVEQQQERGRYRRKSVSGFSAWAKAASRRAVLCTSSSSTISTGECM